MCAVCVHPQNFFFRFEDSLITSSRNKKKFESYQFFSLIRKQNYHFWSKFCIFSDFPRRPKLTQNSKSKILEIISEISKLFQQFLKKWGAQVFFPSTVGTSPLASSQHCSARAGQERLESRARAWRCRVPESPSARGSSCAEARLQSSAV